MPLHAGSSGSSGIVGAAQVAVRLSELAGTAADDSSCDGADVGTTLLQRCAAAAALLPATLRPALLIPPGAGFAGQAALLSVRLGELLPPSSSIGGDGRPKSDRYYCCYSLPGTPITATTPPRMLAAVGSLARAAAVSRGRKSATGVAAAAAAEARALPEQRWMAAIDHASSFEVRRRCQLYPA